MALDPLAPLKLGVRLGIGVVRFELRLIESLLGMGREQPEGVVVVPEPGSAVAMPDVPDIPDVSEPQPTPPPVAPRRPEAVAEPDEPVHIDTEPELVAEFAEPGAEEGAGPEIHVDEPWDGYKKMAAADIRDRVLVGGPEEVAVVQLYETMHRKRRTVLDAVERRRKELANAPSAR